MKPEGGLEVLEGLDEQMILRHIKRAQTTIRGEHQIEEYVGRLDVGECARILAASPQGLPLLAARRDECRVGPDEKRSFEKVIRAWTLELLSTLEGS
ncbi:MAG TPA: hypothetical protein VEY13_07175 [Rubrobacteraceae bacterium]|nr:hypothetical protein [Rubrobacteraceae bacterium]